MVLAQKNVAINRLLAAVPAGYERASSVKAEVILRSSFARKSDHIPTRKLSVDKARTCS
jgi:hypothetical protein